MKRSAYEKKFVVYCHELKSDGRKYFGITSQKPMKRWGYNGCLYYGSRHFYFAIKKYGWNNFNHIVLYTDLTKDEACSKERELIKKYKTQDSKYGFNLSGGGDGLFNYIYTEEQLKHRSQVLMGHKMSEETKQKISKAHIGKKMPPRSEEYKRKISLRQKGVKKNPEITAKRAITNRKLYGKPVVKFDLEGNEIERFDGLRQVARSTGNVKRYTDIRKLCNHEYGKRTVCGYIWKYLNEVENANC